MEYGGNGDVELYSDVLRVHTKVFYFDIKSNSRGRYLKLSEKGRNRPKSSIVLPLHCLPQFMAMVDYYLHEASHGRSGAPRDMVVDCKVFSFSGGDNERGRFLRIFESGGGYPAGGSSLMIAAEGQHSNLCAFGTCVHNLMAYINNAAFQELGHVRLPGAAVGAIPSCSSAGFNAGAAFLDVTRDGTPILNVGSKHFFFDLRSNDRGPYLRIKEVSGSLRNVLVVPLSAVSHFQEAIQLALISTPTNDVAMDRGIRASSSTHWDSRV